MGWIVGMIAGSLAALSMKRRLVPTTDESADEIVAVRDLRAARLPQHGHRLPRRRARMLVRRRRCSTCATPCSPPKARRSGLRAIFGGGQILVPPDWHVVIRVRGMGGIGDTRPAKGYKAGAPELVIEGMAIAGGFAVTSELADGEAEWLAGMKGKTGGNGAADISPAATVIDASDASDASDTSAEELAPAT